MLKVSNNVISLTRGDTAEISIGLEGYTMQDDDVMVMTVKDSTSSAEALISKEVSSDVFYFKPEDTSSLAYGVYYYDVQLTTSTGEVYTVITPTKFKILEEVTW